MPLKTRLTEQAEAPAPGYEMVWMNGRQQWWHTHHLADRHNLITGVYRREAGAVRHHVDFDKRNNDPRNILRLSKEAHLELHAAMLGNANRARWQNPAYRAARLRLLRESALRQWQDPAYRAARSAFTRRLAQAERARLLWSQDGQRDRHRKTLIAWWQANPEHREKVRAARRRGWVDPATRAAITNGLRNWRTSTTFEDKGIRSGHKIKALILLNRVLGAPDVRAAYDELRRSSAPTALTYESLLHRRFDGDVGAMREAAINVNCQVVSVRPLTECADVYDLTVERYHNFALAAGVFVHNSAKQGRDATYQAILALRGKPINVVNARPERLQLNKEYGLMASVIGTGVRGAFNLERCKYDKVIIMTDADVDGGHIRALLLALFYQEMPGLIEAGKVYVAMPPLYSVTWKSKTQWLLDDDALRRFYSRNQEAKNVPLKRYKGLGEMKASELRETTMHPATRVLKQVTLEDSSIAAQVVADLMDESRPEARREFLAQAARLTDLDV
jgi:DNA gyrase subunit B